MKILKKGNDETDAIIECNNCKGEMNLVMEDEGGLRLFICKKCGTNLSEIDAYVEWTYPEILNKPKFEEECLDLYENDDDNDNDNDDDDNDNDDVVKKIRESLTFN